MAVTDLSQFEWVRYKKANTNIVEVAVPVADNEQVQALFTLKLLDADKIKFVAYGADKDGGVIVDLTTSGVFRRYHKDDVLIVSGINNLTVVDQTEYQSFYVNDANTKRYDAQTPRINYTVPVEDTELTEIKKQVEEAKKGKGGSAATGPKSPRDGRVEP